ncbi:MAG: hypothetical protein U0X40_11450 [Ferruginibacter sp.]
MRKIAVFLSLLATAPLSLFAHPGHGETDGFTITHYFVEPIHVVALVGVVSLAVITVKALNRKRQRKESL